LNTKKIFKQRIIPNTTKARIACTFVPYKIANKAWARQARVYKGERKANRDAIEL